MTVFPSLSRAALLAMALMLAAPTHAAMPATPALHVTTLDGKTFDLAAQHGKWVIVNFWATWCVPCVQELPGFEQLNEKYATGKVKVLLVSMDFSEDHDTKLIPFLVSKNIRSEVLLLDEVNANYFIPKLDSRWTGSLPCTLIINGPKKIKECYEKKVTFEFLEERLKAASK